MTLNNFHYGIKLSTVQYTRPTLTRMLSELGGGMKCSESKGGPKLKDFKGIDAKLKTFYKMLFGPLWLKKK